MSIFLVTFFLQISWGMCLYTAQHSNLTVIFFLIITWRSLQQHSLSALTFSYLTKTRWDRELSLDFQSQLLLLIFRIFLFVVFTLAYGNYEFSLFSSLLCSPACSLILIERDLIVFIFILGCLFYNCWEINFAFNLFTSFFLLINYNNYEAALSIFRLSYVVVTATTKVYIRRILGCSSDCWGGIDKKKNCKTLKSFFFLLFQFYFCLARYFIYFLLWIKLTGCCITWLITDCHFSFYIKYIFIYLRKLYFIFIISWELCQRWNFPKHRMKILFEVETLSKNHIRSENERTIFFIITI